MVAAVLKSRLLRKRGCGVGLQALLESGTGTEQRISRQQYGRQQDRLRVDLVNAQFDLLEVKLPVMVLIAGDDRIGINEVVQLLHAWMDARYLDTQIALEPTPQELQHPPFWPFWRALPPRGRIGLYVGGWVVAPIRGRLARDLDDDAFEAYLGHAARFEQALAADGALVLKLWLHLPRKELKRRLAGERPDEDAAWQIQDSDSAVLNEWYRWVPLADRLLEATDSPTARWHVIDGTHERARNLTAARIILAGLQRLLARRTSRPGGNSRRGRQPVRYPNALAAIDLAMRFSEDDAYEAALDKQQGALARLTREAREEGLSSVVVLEGWDAAGKGGAIRRLTRAMEVRDYRVVPIAAPTPEEQAHHYLWRFWRHLPPAGQMTIFDRSWYGRVLVERVEGFARPEAWERAYDEILDFERQLLEHGTVLLKFWLHIDADEQLDRFAAREKTPFKKYRIGTDDYRNRARRADYVSAANEMVARTSTKSAPWHLIPANDKRYARVAVARTLCGALRKAL